MDYRAFIEEQLQLAAKTAQQFFGKVSTVVKSHDNNQVLTEADLAIGKQLVAAIQKQYPDHNIIDEEAGIIDKGSRYTWTVDPIEATSNFAAGQTDYGILLGLLEDDEPIAGGVVAPAFNRLYSAAKGQGATCNGQPIHATDEPKLSNVLVSYSLDGHADDPERTYRECRQMADVVLAVRNIRNSNCEATDAVYVADGRYGGRVNHSSKIWDNVAPQIVCQEAGALWTDIDGNPIDYSQPLTKSAQNFTFCVAPKALHQQLQAALHGKPA